MRRGALWIRHPNRCAPSARAAVEIRPCLQGQMEKGWGGGGMGGVGVEHMHAQSS